MLNPRSCAAAPPVPIPDTSHSAFSCIAPSSYLRFPRCCLPSATSYQAADNCFQWCHTYDDWYRYTSTWPLATFDVGNSTAANDTDRLRRSFKACLAADGATVADADVVCQANSDATVPSDYNFFGPNNFSCDLIHPSTALGLQPNSGPSCGMRFIGNADGSGNNTGTFDHCCGWSPRKLDTSKCYEYCTLPRGNAFRGAGNLTGDEALGSFKKCMQNHGGGWKGLDGVYCSWNEDMIDITAYNVTTSAYLDAGGSRRPRIAWTVFASALSLVLMAFMLL